MKRLMLALLVVGATVTMIGMVTLANFSDTEESTGNTATAGTLDLLVGTGSAGPTCTDPVNNPSPEFTVTNMAPGGSAEQTPCLKNDGSIDASDATLEYTITAELENGGNDPEGDVDATCDNTGPGDGELDSNLDVETWVDDGAGGGTACDNVKNGDEAAVGALTGKLIDIQGGGAVSLGTGVGAGAFICVGIELSVDGSVGNIIQSDSVTFTKTYGLKQ